MKLFILSDPNSIHTKRWVSSLSKKGFQIFLFGVNHSDEYFYNQYDNVTVYAVDYSSRFKQTSFRKVRYLNILNVLKKKIIEFKPDILHAHYASSYGLLGALVKFHPYIISCWGSDVYEFPTISFLHRATLKFSLSKADYLLSTSKIMVKEIEKYTTKHIEITPFGVDLELFRKIDIPKLTNEFIVGTVKTLTTVYRIDLLIKSFKLVLENNPNLFLKLHIIGDGRDKQKLQILTQDLGINESVEFLGKVDNKLLPDFYNSFSVFASLSDSESFGVVAVEAMACECPVVVSDAFGFTEVVVDRLTGFIVPKGNQEESALAIQKLIDSETLRCEMGKNGRKRVEQLFNWEKNVDQMIQIYYKTLS